MTTDTTICALSTAQGNGAIAVVRLSGKEALSITDRVFKTSNQKKVSAQHGYTIHYGQIIDNEKMIDEVLVSVFKTPHSYTGEDMVEISCHGSTYIEQEIIQLLIKHGAKPAGAGEFTQRAFLNGKMDLTQAEAVADVIASQSEAMHRVAMNQMKGGFASELSKLREQLLHFISLIELELDFSEEDVEFADRSDFVFLIQKIETTIKKLLDSFQLGNAIKNGIPVVIAGKPNVGKSTLLNLLLNEEKAIVTEIAGTTRDVIEDVMNIDGVLFRFIDTAGLRETIEAIEKIGIERTHQSIAKARILLLMVDVNDSPEEIKTAVSSMKLKPDQKMIVVGNKCDKLDNEEKLKAFEQIPEFISISAKEQTNLDVLIDRLKAAADTGKFNTNEVLVTNARHYEALLRAHESTQRVVQGLHSAIPTDLLTVDIRETLHHLGEITGHITTDEVLGNIFKNFCIGK
jgi:tRNA modification GTPase